MLYFREVYTYKWTDSESVPLPPIKRAHFLWNSNMRELSFIIIIIIIIIVVIVIKNHKPHLNIRELDTTFSKGMPACSYLC
jgi:hypothetical protein